MAKLQHNKGGLMKAKSIFGLVALLLIALSGIAVASHVEDLPVVIDSVEVEDVELDADSNNRLDIERGEEIEVEVRFTATDFADNVEVRASIRGYEYNDYNDVSDSTHVFDIEPNTTYVKRLHLMLPDDIEKDSYRLRVEISDRNSREITQRYSLLIDEARHRLRFEDVLVNPSSAVKAGRALLTTVRLENMGQKDENNVKVTVSIPELGLSVSDFIDEIERDESEETEEMFMRFDTCAKAGDYELLVEVKYDRARETMSKSMLVRVLENDQCDDGKKAAPSIIIGSTSLTIKGGESAAVPITIANNAKSSKSFSLALSGAEDFEYSISPGATAVLAPGESQSFAVSLTPKKGWEGSKALTLSITSGSEKVYDTVINVSVEKNKSFGAAGVLEVILIILVVVLVILGVILGVTRAKSGEKTYY